MSTTDAGRVREQYVPKEESEIGRDEQRDESDLSAGNGGRYSNLLIEVLNIMSTEGRSRAWADLLIS